MLLELEYICTLSTIRTKCYYYKSYEIECNFSDSNSKTQNIKHFISQVDDESIYFHVKTLNHSRHIS